MDGRGWQQPHHRQRGHGFSGPGLADERHRLALGDVEGRAGDRDDALAGLPELDAEIPYRQERRRLWLAGGGEAAGEVDGGDHRNVLRGSKASRTASPTKMSSDSMIEMTRKPVKPSHGAWMLSLPWASSSPSDGEPGGRPKPRKSSAVR